MLDRLADELGPARVAEIVVGLLAEADQTATRLAGDFGNNLASRAVSDLRW